MALFKIYRKLLFTSGLGQFASSRREILSVAYQCKEEWQKRLQEPALANINAEDFFFQVNERVKKNLPMEPIDVDLFVQVASVDSNLDEFLYFAKILRENWRCVDVLDSTHHAFVRLALHNNTPEKAVPVLEDRLKYGIFPDLYALNLLLDHFLEAKDYANATRISHHIMLQEDFSNSLSNIFCLKALFSCLMDPTEKTRLVDLIMSKNEKEEGKEEEQEGEEDEDTYVRVPYVRNPHFDDHFDIKDPLLLTGKSLYLFGRHFDDAIGRTSQLVGLIYYKKFDEAKKLMEKFISSHKSECFATGVIELISQSSNDNPVSSPSEDDSSTRESSLNDNEGSSNESIQVAEDVSSEIVDRLRSLPGCISSKSISDHLESHLERVNQLEAADIASIKSLYETWKDERQNMIDKKLEEYLREEKLKEIRKIRRDLKEKERFLGFFENEEKLLLEHARAKKRIREQKIEKLEEEYFPPTIEESTKLRSS
ncbi:uncharacterized protein LOC141858561 [Brevipalpus obovatus]|uniref:uncharacterized protein LOC141858561 n=1 Tax=Brevipalpus obovatus TaxID=246614 RepID=UPI003D9E20EA